MLEVCDHDVETQSWVASDGTNNVMKLDIHAATELIGAQGDPFDGRDPDERVYEGYVGNSGPELHYCYHVALGVVWLRGVEVPLQRARPVAGSSPLEPAIAHAEGHGALEAGKDLSAILKLLDAKQQPGSS